MSESKQKNFSKKIGVCLAFMLMFTTLFSSVELNQTENTVWGAEVVRISKTSMTMEIGKSKILKVIGTKKKVKWSSSNKSVATVSSNGKVKAKKAGRAMRESLSDPIVGTLEDGKVKFTYKSDWGNSGTGTIIFHDKYIELKTDGNDFLSTDNKTIKLKWINKNTDIMQIY